jgi:NitT/TauT family transport system ATP-binding protein
VTKTYDDGFTRQRRHVLRRRQTERDEFITILGPSGTKSTILRLIAGCVRSFCNVRHGARVRPTGARPRRRSRMVFQDYTSFDNRTVEDNVAFGLECRGMPAKERREQAREWIGKVGLNVDRDSTKYPHQLSGGMRQRVAIARSLILGPKIMLMDEPFGALDPRTRLNMQDMLVSLSREAQATVFFVTHSIEEASIGDRTFIISSAPGTILRECRCLHRTSGPRDAAAAQVHGIVFEIRDIMEGLESSTRAGDE